MTSTQTPGGLHRRISVDTPEHVRIDYALADLGSRAAAYAIDYGVMGVGLTLLGLILRWANGLGVVVEAMSVPVLIFAVFFIQWGYFLLFEGLAGGRTPGKRALGLRVIHAAGEPLSFRGAVLRNLIRVIDVQPAITGLVGTTSILVNRRAQRLGDLVAGTIVVLDAGGRERLGTDAPPPARVGHPVLTPAQFELLAGYVARRADLAADVRRRVAASVAGALADALADALDKTSGPAEGAGELRGPSGNQRTRDQALVELHEAEAPRHAARRGGASLQAATLAREQRKEWERYVDLVERGAKQGLASLTDAEVRAFGRLYRGLTADLARARTYGASPGLVGTIQRWVGSGHNLLYRARGRTAVSLGHWVAAGFPSAVRAHWRHMLLAALVFYGPAAPMYQAVRADPLLGRTSVLPGMLARAENTERDNIDAVYLERQVEGTEMPALASGLMTHNIGVTFFAFAGGLLAGIGTLYVLILNGVSLGATLGAYANEGVLGVILAFVFPHGFIELTAICIAGAAGFGLGSAILLPGRLSRAEAIQVRGRTFVSLLAGTTLMLVIAGLIEGFYSPAALPATAKFAFGTVTAVALAAYFGLAGRGAARKADAAA